MPPTSTAVAPIRSRLSARLRSPWWLVAVVVTLGLAWRILRWTLGFPIWGDEGFTAVNFLTRSYSQMLEGLDHAQVVPLGMLWSTLALANVFGDSEWSLRLYSLFAGIAGLLLMTWWAPRAMTRRAGFVAVMILAASYYPVRHGAEVKPYAGDMLVAVLILMAAWWLRRELRRAERWAVYTLAVGAGVWFSYPSLFISAGTGIALVLALAGDKSLRGAAKAWGGAAVAAVALVVSSLVMWKVFGWVHYEANKILAQTEHWELAFPPTPAEGWGGWWGWPLRMIWWFLEVHTGNMMAYPAGGKDAGSILTFLLCLAGIIALRRQRTGLLGLLLWPMGMCFLASCLQLYPYGGSARTMQGFAPGICMLAGAGLMGLLEWRGGPVAQVRGLRVAAIVMVVVIAVGVVADLKKPYKKLDDLESRATVVELFAESPPNTRWIVIGSLDGTDYAPKMIAYGGRWARTRYYLIREARRRGIELTFAPDPATLPPHDGPTVLLAYWQLDNARYHTFPEAQIASFVDATARRVEAEPKPEQRSVAGGFETIYLYRFDPEPSEQRLDMGRSAAARNKDYPAIR